MGKRPMEYKSGGFAVAYKGGASGNGKRFVIRGLASDYNPDLGGDVVRPGAYGRTIEENPQIPLLWQHQSETPIGKVTTLAEQRDTGLLFEAEVVPTRQGKDAQILLESGSIAGISIGYDAMKVGTWKDPDGVPYRELQQIRLWELSLVTFPMNERAAVTGVEWKLQQVMSDALLIAKVDKARERGQPVNNKTLGRYAEAQRRELERLSHGGLTLAEMRLRLLAKVMVGRHEVRAAME